MMLIIAISCIGVLFQVAEPITLLKRYIGFKEEEYVTYSKKKRFIHKLIYCCLCSSFWIGLIITGDIFTSSIISILSELIYKKITN